MASRILVGDCRELLTTLLDGSVQTCVTSPPYFGLRDYGTADWTGGDPACDHKQGRNGSGRADGIVDDRGQRNRDGVGAMGGDCRTCGAVRVDRQIGLEASLDQYVAELVAVFREVRRVLHDTGTLWLNLGDSYAGAGAGGGGNRKGNEHGQHDALIGMGIRGKVPTGYKPKDLLGVPWRVAFALQADGWYLRSDIVWHKPNPMPESVRDRPTSAYEHIFLLTKSGRYYYDASAIAEPVTRGDAGSTFTEGKTAVNGCGRVSKKPRRIKVPGGLDTGTGAHGTIHRNGRTEAEYREIPKQDQLGFNERWASRPEPLTMRNARNVWTIPTAGFAEAHFAVFPTEIPRRCILAGSREGDTVLDPFSGAGTTLLVADRLGRNAIGVEVNPDYVALAERRIRSDAPLFAEVESL